eukprot:11279384-Alexandrium_andersonii.AAC.1
MPGGARRGTAAMTRAGCAGGGSTLGPGERGAARRAPPATQARRPAGPAPQRGGPRGPQGAERPSVIAAAVFGRWGHARTHARTHA